MVYDFYRAKLISILMDVPKPVKQKDVEVAIPIHRDRPMNTLLTKELMKYEQLIIRVRGNLE